MSTTLTKSINDLNIGQKAIIEHNADTALQELGFIPGEHVSILAKASFGGPIAVRVGSSVFALRVEEAASIKVCIDLPDKCS
jgi:Fe2+ transport system protein FeoA